MFKDQLETKFCDLKEEVFFTKYIPNPMSSVIINGSLSYLHPDICLADCLLSALLFAITSHSLFCYAQRQAHIGRILGLQVQHKQMGLAYDTLIFLKACNLNLKTYIIKYLKLFSLFVCLNLIEANMPLSTFLLMTFRIWSRMARESKNI